MVLLEPSTKDQLEVVDTRIEVGGIDTVPVGLKRDRRPYDEGRVVGAYSDPYARMAAGTMIEIQEPCWVTGDDL